MENKATMKTSKWQWCLDNGIPEEYVEGVLPYVDKMKKAKAFTVAKDVFAEGENQGSKYDAPAFLFLWRLNKVQIFIVGSKDTMPIVELPINHIDFVKEVVEDGGISVYVDYCLDLYGSPRISETFILKQCPFRNSRPFEKCCKELYNKSGLLTEKMVDDIIREQNEKWSEYDRINPIEYGACG